MSNQTIPAVTDEERMLAREWAAYIESSKDSWGDSGNDPWGDRVRAAAHVILNAVPVPAPTLADMTPAERESCRWMQADVGQRSRVVIIAPSHSRGSAALLGRRGNAFCLAHDAVTPRPDLPRLAWPGTEKPDPAPTVTSTYSPNGRSDALPEGWRCAVHEVHGRVVVTNPRPDDDGEVYFAFPTDDLEGYDSDTCRPDELTYINEKLDPAPAPALPGKWRRADHEVYGRVIVTNSTPNVDGYVYGMVASDRDSAGFGWLYCDPAKLTYLDTEPEGLK